jgi:hypothetical protein
MMEVAMDGVQQGPAKTGRVERSEMELMLQGYGLTTASILYRMPDHRSVLQTFIWQDYDLAPDFHACSAFSISGARRSKARCTRCSMPTGG